MEGRSRMIAQFKEECEKELGIDLTPNNCFELGVENKLWTETTKLIYLKWLENKYATLKEDFKDFDREWYNR